MDQQKSEKLLEFIKVKDSDESETVHYAAFWEGMSDEYKTFAEKELGETPEKVSRGINYLKMFSEDKGLPQTDDINLLAVLRNCKYDLNKSKVKLEKFLRVRAFIVEKVAELDLDKMDAMLNDGCFALLPYRDRHRRLIAMTQPTVNLEAYSLNETFICASAAILYLLTYPTTSLYGFAYIADSRTPSVSLMYQILLAYRTWCKALLDLPLPLRKVDVTNEHVLIRWFLNIARPFIPSKIYKRISVHGSNLESLKKVYHPDLLPEELEGNLGPIRTKFFRDKLLDFMRKLKDEHRAKVTAQE